ARPARPAIVRRDLPHVPQRAVHPAREHLDPAVSVAPVSRAAADAAAEANPTQPAIARRRLPDVPHRLVRPAGEQLQAAVDVVGQHGLQRGGALNRVHLRVDAALTISDQEKPLLAPAGPPAVLADPDTLVVVVADDADAV